jgi:mannose-1-phosphate guanylyltransferase
VFVLKDPVTKVEPPGGFPSRPVWVVVLAGGQGTRLQTFLRQFLGSDRPKQFCRIIGSQSMLRHTWDRAAQVVPAERTVTIITAGQEPYIEEELRHGLPGVVLVQPANKETAPGLLLPLLWIARRDPLARVVVYPADHFIWQEARFAACVREALQAVEQLSDRLILLGVEADDPEPGYGWIDPAEPIQTAGAGDLYAVRRFWEKPDRRTAAQLFASGCFWNTLVLVGHLETYLRLAQTCIPDVLSSLLTVASHLDTPHAAASLARVYRRLHSTNFSRAILSQASEALLLQAVRNVYWSDWGDPERIVRTVRRFTRRPTWLPAYALAQGVVAGA